QAAILHIKLRDLDRRNQMRQQHAQTYEELLSCIPGIVTPFVPDGIMSVNHLYVIRAEKGLRNDLQRYLKDRGVQTGVHYPTPIHRTRAFSGFRTCDCPIAENYSEKILSLPLYPEMERHQIQYTAEVVDEYMRACDRQQIHLRLRVGQ